MSDASPVVGKVVVMAAPGRVVIEPLKVEAPGQGELRIRTEASGISAGTELLFYKGLLEAGVAVDGTLDVHAEPLRYPLRYGYCNVGRVDACGQDVDPSWLGRRVFSFQPHQTHSTVAADSVVALPDGVSAKAGTLLANVETAVSLLMDAAPVLGEDLLVLGQGVVGQLVAAIAARLNLGRVVVVDTSDRRLELAKKATPSLEVVSSLDALAGQTFDVGFELTGSPEVFARSFQRLRYEGRLVVGSWYGAKTANLSLGTHVHRNRNQVLFSQVSHIDSRHAARFDKQRRMAVAKKWLKELPVETLITHTFAQDRAADAYEALSGAGAADGVLGVVLEYGDSK